MPPTDRKTKSKVIGRSIVKVGSHFSRIQLVTFAFLFSAVGGYSLISTFAATPPSYHVSGSCNADGSGGLTITSSEPDANFYYSIFAGPSYSGTGDRVVSPGQDLLGNTGPSGSITFTEPYDNGAGYNDGYGINNGSNTPVGGTVASVPPCYPAAVASYTISANCNTGGFVVHSNPANAKFYYSVYAGSSYSGSGDRLVSSAPDLTDYTGSSGSILIPEPPSTTGYNLGGGINNANNTPTGVNASLPACSAPVAATYSITANCSTGGFIVNSNPAGAKFYYSVFSGPTYTGAGDQPVSTQDITDYTLSSGSVLIPEPPSSTGYNLGGGINDANNTPTGVNASIPACASGTTQQIAAGGRLASSNGDFYVTPQTDGNVVIYDLAGVAVWSSQTGHGAGYANGGVLRQQTDGNLVFLTSGGAVIWSSINKSDAQGTYTLKMQTDGNLVTLNSAGAVIWSAGFNVDSSVLSVTSSCGTGGSYSFTVRSSQPNTPFYYSIFSGGPSYSQSQDTLFAGGDALNVTGPNGEYILSGQSSATGYNDGNGINNYNNTPAGSTATGCGTSGSGGGGDTGHTITPPITGTASNLLTVNDTLSGTQELVSPTDLYVLKMQPADGNLVVYTSTGIAVWDSATSTGSNLPNHLIMQNDGNLVMLNSAGKPVWDTESNNTGSNNYLSMQDDGNLVVYTHTGVAVWASGLPGEGGFGKVGHATSGGLLTSTPPNLGSSGTGTPIPPTTGSGTSGSNCNVVSKAETLVGNTKGGRTTVNQAALAAIAQSSTATQNAICAGFSLIGIPYVWGGSSPAGFDCSGLVQYILKSQGLLNIPHNSAAQWGDVGPLTRIGNGAMSAANLKPGDIIFYGQGAGQHEVMYIGGGQVIAAQYTGTVVGVFPFTSADMWGAGYFAPIGQ